MSIPRRAAPLLAVLAIAGCGSSASGDAASSGSAGGTTSSSLPKAKPQAVEPTAGQQAITVSGDPPVGDVHAHAPSLAVVKSELQLELVAVHATNGKYIDPLRFVTDWQRTDQGVDAAMPIGAPILAPCKVKILAVIPNWFEGQPLVYFELLTGPDAGKIQYVAEQITDIAPVGIVPAGGVIARFARTGTDIEYGWSTKDGVTLARATTGYEEGQVTPAGRSMRDWLNSLGANAGPS